MNYEQDSLCSSFFHPMICFCHCLIIMEDLDSDILEVRVLNRKSHICIIKINLNRTEVVPPLFFAGRWWCHWDSCQSCLPLSRTCEGARWTPTTWRCGPSRSTRWWSGSSTTCAAARPPAAYRSHTCKCGFSSSHTYTHPSVSQSVSGKEFKIRYSFLQYDINL